MIFDKFKKNIPHLLFYGNTDNNTIKTELLKIIDKNYILELYCGINKGIKNIRDDIVSFVKFQTSNHILFKCVILYDAEYLTIESQYLLRRIIEIYSTNTRFIIITNDKDKLLKPIRSRFIHIYNEYQEKESITYIPYQKINHILSNHNDITDIVNKLYINGIYSDIFIKYIKHKVKHYIELQFQYENMCSILKNEKFILFYLVCFFRNNNKIEI